MRRPVWTGHCAAGWAGWWIAAKMPGRPSVGWQPLQRTLWRPCDRHATQAAHPHL